jgi:DNA-binding Lrp family transcriptional regulator
MDATDQAILEVLDGDGRASHRAIAEALGLSPRIVSARIEGMLERREMRVAAVADVFEAGNDLVLAVGVAVRGRATIDVAEELAGLAEVCAVNVVTGEWDLEVLVLAADHEALRDLVSTRLSAIDGIERLSPALGLELFKFESTWSRF